MTKPSASLPVLYARVPVETYALAQLLAGEGKTSVSAWLVALIEKQRGKRQHVAAVAQHELVAAEHEPGIAAVAPVKRGRGRPRKQSVVDREDGHQRAAEAACSGDE
jgi:hypothetical protein